MSIYFDFEVGPRGRRFRRAVDGDKHDINLFMDVESEKLFGKVDIGELIELATLSICMINAEKEVVGFLALCDHPNIPGVDPADWEAWIRNLFQRYYLSSNTLFIHYICCVESVREVFLDEALKTVFDNDMYLKQIVLTVPPLCPEEIINRHPIMKKKHVFKHYAKFQDFELGRHMFTFGRNEFCPKLRMRRAVEEDNDDIVKILDKTCPKLRNLYGDYYISELIGRHPESQRKIIVAEHQDRAVAVMCLNEDINYQMLASIYEVRPYYGLRKATALEKEHEKKSNTLLTTFGEPILTGKWSPYAHDKSIEMVMQESLSQDDQPDEAKKNSKVYFGSRKSLDHIIYRAQQQHTSDDYSDKMYPDSPVQSIQSRGTTYSISDLLDADPFDYEIVNIDYDLINVPDVSTYPDSSMELEQKVKEYSDMKKRGRRQSIYGKKLRTSETSESIDYGGEPNAFKIELLGVRDGFSDSLLFDLLEAAFEIMKNYDYCIIRTPCAEKWFRLLQHFCFVPTQPGICCKHALYIAHKSSVLGRLRVKEAEIADIPQIAKLLNNLEAKETLWTVENTIHTSNQYKAYVFVTGASIIGVAILEPPEQIDFIRAELNMAPFHNHKYHFRGHGSNAGFSNIKVVQVFPVFEVHFRFFAREMMRLSGTSTLLWLTAYRNKWEARKANSLTTSMIPLLPKKSKIDCTAVFELRKFGHISQKITAFSTWYIGRKFTSVPKVDINTRIVVVGASRTAMAFLNSLLFTDASSYLHFNCVTLVSPDGLPCIRHAKHSAESMFPRYRTGSDKFLKSVPYTYYVNIVQGTMVEINRKDHCIILRTGHKYYYDMLFLLLGKQYQHPNYLKEVYEKERQEKLGFIPPYVRLDVPRADLETHIGTENPPPNVFIVNNLVVANRAITYVKDLVNDKPRGEKIIVYGATIHAYCCLAALLEANVPPESIIFVEPFPPEDTSKIRVPIFCNANVDQTIRDVLNNMKMTVYRSYYFQSWSLDEAGMVSHVEFLSYYKMVRLECAAFFYYGKRGINANALDAINKSGLVYDGGILIDHQFRTKDPNIYAAGTATRYYRRYFADTYRQKYFDSQEIGEKGYVMETFKRGYFKIHLDNHYVVDGITCLSTEKFSLENFQHIYGLPANVLNNVYLRYTAKKLDDFYEFFRAPWAFFLYHDQCDDLFAMARELRPKGQRNGETLGETLKAIVENKLENPSLRFNTITKVRSKFEHSAHMEAITDYVIEWVGANDVSLPMYVCPGQLLYFTRDIATNPAFRRRRSNVVRLMRKILG